MHFDLDDDDLARAEELFGHGQGPFNEAVGFVFDSVSLDRLEGHADLDERHHQPYGIVHGGVYASIVEVAASFAAALNVTAAGKVAVGVSNTTDFVRAHRRGRLDVVATPIHRGRLQHLWEVHIRRADGKLVARGQVRVQIIDPLPDES